MSANDRPRGRRFGRNGNLTVALSRTILRIFAMPVNLGHRVLPALLVTDMRRTLDFYVELLGFVQTGLLSDRK